MHTFFRRINGVAIGLCFRDLYPQRFAENLSLQHIVTKDFPAG